MSRLSTDEFIRRFNKAVQRRQNWDQRIQEVYDFCVPNRDDMYTIVSGEDRTSEIYDDTAVSAAEDFAGMMHEGMLPPNGQIVVLKPSVNMREGRERDELADYLMDVTVLLHEVINASDLHMSLAEGFLDYAVSTMNLQIEPSAGSDIIRSKAYPISTCYLDNGPFGGVDGQFHAFKMTIRDLKVRYPQATVPTNFGENEDALIDIIDGVYRDWENPLIHKYHRHLVARQRMHGGNNSELQYQEFNGDGSNPNIAARFSTASGEVWGRGPGYNTLASIKTVNLSSQLTLENADLAIGGIWKAPHDGVINPNNIELVPGTIVPYMPGTNGLEPLKSPASFDLSNFISQEYREQIRRGFYVEDYEGRGDTPISAREVQARQTRLAQRVGRPFVRGMRELVLPVIKRVLFLMSEQGQIDQIATNQLFSTIRIVSPLMQQLNSQKVLKTIDSIQALNATIGPQQTQMFINSENVAAHIIDMFEQPANFIRSREELAEALQNMQQLGSIVGGAGHPSREQPDI